MYTIHKSEEKTMEILSHSVEETREAAGRIAKTARPGDVFSLIGELGSGKTEFVRGFVASLCGSCEVRSPTFTIVNIYESPAMPIYHFDFFRLKKAGELVEIGFDDYIHGEGVSLIEWADLFPQSVPAAARSVRFFDIGNGQRSIVYE